jgi:hypothetical protein
MAPALPSPLRAARKILVIRKTQSTRDVIAEIGESARSHRYKRPEGSSGLFSEMAATARWL